MKVAANGWLPVLALLAAASFWGAIWYPSRHLEAMNMAGVWQTLISYGAVFVLVGLFKGLPRLPQADADRKYLLILFFAAGWTNVAFVLAVLTNEVVRVMIFFYLSPLWTILLGRWLLNEHLTGASKVALSVSLLGAVVMLWNESMLSTPIGKGDALALSAGLAFALTNVMTRRLQHCSTMLKTQATWMGVVVISIVMIMLLDEPMPDSPPIAWGGAIALGVFGFLLTTLFVVYAVSQMPVQRSSVIMLFEVIVGAASAWWLANEQIDLQEWVGGALVLGGGLIAVFFQPESE